MLAYNQKMHEMECSLADLIVKQNSSGCDEINPVQESLDDAQFCSVVNACAKSLSVLRGLPGTGKTTSLQQIIESFSAAGMRGLVACPTGKAAKRAHEIVSKLSERDIEFPECITAHRALGFSNGKFIHCQGNKLDIDYVVLDEFSMAGLTISHALFSAIDPKKTRVVLCGDNNQLPSVDPGAVFRDIINSGCVPDTYLTKIYRQGANSGIVKNANRILCGNKMRTEDEDGVKFDDIFFVNKLNEQFSHEYICDIICEKIPSRRGFDSLRDIQLLCPGKNGEVGTKSMNASLRERLNGGGRVGYYKFKKNDKVINRKNNYDLGIVNGDVGVVADVGISGMEVDFGKGAGKDGTGVVKLVGDTGSNIHLAYAFTVHSSQGSEFECVVMSLHRSHFQLLDRNILYTGITRGKKLSIIVGDSSCLDRCISNDSADRRITGLQKRISALSCQ